MSKKGKRAPAAKSSRSPRSSSPAASPFAARLESLTRRLEGAGLISRKTARRGQGAEMAVVLISGALLLFAGQALRTVLPEGRTWVSGASTVLGLLLFLMAVRSFSTGTFPTPVKRVLSGSSGWLGVSQAQIVLLALAPVLSLLAWFAAGTGMRMPLPVLAPLFWITAVGLVILGTWQRQKQEKGAQLARVDLFIMLGLFVAAMLARGLNLGGIPWLLTGDEASGGLSAIEFIDGTRNNIFDVAWLSFPSLYFFLQSLPIRILGQSTEALRLSSALAGALTPVFLYLFLRQTMGRGIGLAAGFYLAASHFHIHFSRFALNNVWDGLFIVLLSATFWHGWKHGIRLSFALAGLAFGLAQYFYASSRVLLLLFPIWLTVAALRERDAFRARIPHLVSMILAAVVIALPLAMFYQQNTGALLDPLNRVSYVGKVLEADMQATGESAIQLLAAQFKTSAMAFTSTNLRFWYQPQTPMLLPVAATLFLMGVVLLLLRIGKLPELWLFLWMAGAIAVGALSESVPAAQRYVFAAPAVATLVALPLGRGAEWLSKAWPSMRLWILLFLSAILVYAAWWDLRFYFVDFSANRRFGDVNTETANAVAEFLRQGDPARDVYFFGGRMGYRTHSTIPYLVPQAEGQDVMETQSAPPSWSLTRLTTFIFLPERESELQLVEQAYPGGVTYREQGRDLPLFIAYTVSED